MTSDSTALVGDRFWMVLYVIEMSTEEMRVHLASLPQSTSPVAVHADAVLEAPDRTPHENWQRAASSVRAAASILEAKGTPNLGQPVEEPGPAVNHDGRPLMSSEKAPAAHYDVGTWTLVEHALTQQARAESECARRIRDGSRSYPDIPDYVAAREEWARGHEKNAERLRRALAQLRERKEVFTDA